MTTDKSKMSLSETVYVLKEKHNEEIRRWREKFYLAEEKHGEERSRLKHKALEVQIELLRTKKKMSELLSKTKGAK